jgi:hypothetical protein
MLLDAGIATLHPGLYLSWKLEHPSSSVVCLPILLQGINMAMKQQQKAGKVQINGQF